MALNEARRSTVAAYVQPSVRTTIVLRDWAGVTKRRRELISRIPFHPIRIKQITAGCHAPHHSRQPLTLASYCAKVPSACRTCTRARCRPLLSFASFATTW
jgi:hypothetical protein